MGLYEYTLGEALASFFPVSNRRKVACIQPIVYECKSCFVLQDKEFIGKSKLLYLTWYTEIIFLPRFIKEVLSVILLFNPDPGLSHGQT